MKSKYTLAALGVAALTTAGTALAADTVVAPASTSTPAPVPATAPAGDSWQFGVTVPLWAPQINGNTTIKGVQRNVDISFDQLKDHLDASFALGLEARKGKFGVFGGVGYMKFSADGRVTGGSHAYSDLKFLIVDGGVSYQLVKTESAHPFVLEGTLGVRYWYTDLDLKVKGPLNNVLFNGSATKDLVDPMIGLRGSKYLTEKLHLDFAGDIGGFGISDNQATLDWSATGAVTYDFTSWFSLSGGYKAVGLDASSGSGANKNGVDVIFNGFLLAAKFTF